MQINCKYCFKKLCHCDEERRSNLVAIQIGHALATRLPRYARNDMLFNVPSGSLAEDPDVYAMQIDICARSAALNTQNAGEPQGPLRETLRGRESVR